MSQNFIFSSKKQKLGQKVASHCKYQNAKCTLRNFKGKEDLKVSSTFRENLYEQLQEAFKLNFYLQQILKKKFPLVFYHEIQLNLL